MTPLSLLLSILLLLSFFSTMSCSPMCNNQCCRFVENFPVRLRKLRQDYSQIRDFFEANDDLGEALLDQSVEDSFKAVEVVHQCKYLGTIIDDKLTFELQTEAVCKKAHQRRHLLRAPTESYQQR
ncbi:interleukin-10-like [Labrus bergylta]|uniref:interleukin-10-like n=1 Tax=Labrus bergylta TaxID=56723 RepID=UPI003313640A